jgi:hypothetical protein
VGQPDAQWQASIGDRDIPLSAQGPGPGATAAARRRGVEHGRGDLVHGRHVGARDLEHQLGSPAHPGGGGAPGVAAGGEHGEGGLAAGGVGEVAVVALPRAAVAVEGEEPREEEHGRACLAARAHPAAAQAQRQRPRGGQHGRVVLIGPRHQATGRAGPGVVLPGEKQKSHQAPHGVEGAAWSSSALRPPPPPGLLPLALCTCCSSSLELTAGRASASLSFFRSH